MNSSTLEIAAVVLAGGFGTRIQHLVTDRPKPMALVAGKPFLFWVGSYLARQEVPRAIVSTGYLGNIIADYFAPQPVEGLSVTCRQESEPRGTAGGFLHAIAGGQPTPSAWLVCNGDSLVLAALAPLFRAFEDDRWDAGILGLRMNSTSRYGTLEVGTKGELRGFHEKRPDAGPGLINAGVYLFRSAIASRFPEGATLSFEREVFPHLIQSGARIGVHSVEAPFIDIGTPESLADAESFVTTHRSSFGSQE